MNGKNINFFKKIGIKNKEIVADIGCGKGYYTIPLSRLVGEKGKIFALDISEDKIRFLKKKIQKRNIENIKVIKSSIYDFKIPQKKITFALLSKILHEVEDKNLFLKKIADILKNDGKIVIIEWGKKFTESGPHMSEKLEPHETESYLVNNNFKILDRDSIDSNFYFIKAKYRR